MEARLVTSEKTIKILHVAKTLAKIGDSIISSSKFDFKTESSLSLYYCCRRCELRNNCPQTARAKVLARQLACIGDELMTAKHGTDNDCKRLKLAFIVMLSVGICAKLASFQLNAFI